MILIVFLGGYLIMALGFYLINYIHEIDGDRLHRTKITLGTLCIVIGLLLSCFGLMRLLSSEFDLPPSFTIHQRSGRYFVINDNGISFEPKTIQYSHHYDEPFYDERKDTLYLPNGTKQEP